VTGRWPGFESILQGGTGQDVAVAFEAHVAARLDILILLAELQRVGPDRQAAPAQGGVALRGRFLSGNAFEAVCIEGNGQGAGTCARWFFRGAPRLKPLPLCLHRGRTNERNSQRR